MPPSPGLPSLIADTLAIEAESAQNAGALGFLARAMVQATLPHKKVAGNEFERKNGAYTLHLLAPAKVGLPYGTVREAFVSLQQSGFVNVNLKVESKEET